MSSSVGDNKTVHLSIQQVVKDFDGFKAVNDVSLDIYQGEIFALLGASGCGKSTLLRMLAGFEAPSAGDIVLDGQSMLGVPPHERPVNMMFQSYALFPHMSVAQNIAFGLKQDGMAKNHIAQKVDEVLTLVQMQQFAKRKPHQLSGGQQQRVALARSLAKEPKLLLLDEPMGALDKKLRTQMQLEIVDIIESVGVTCVMVTHDQEEAMTMADRVGIMDAGEIRQIGSPLEVYEQPNSRMTAEFIGSVNVFEGTLSVDEPSHLQISSQDLDVPIYVSHGVSGAAGMDIAFAVRPEKLRVSRDKPAEDFNFSQGSIEDIAYLGSHSIYHIKLRSGKIALASVANSQRLRAGDGRDRLTWGDPVYISWDDNSGVVLTA
ncbi:MAG: polyamine ABC transporter ATP-binding protein [Pseudomonadales bacterium]|nr:polyamine ABC transporter ATP-binding protein [Pseudomonadales bacterium]